MPEVNRGDRPLSPHLQIYRPQMTAISSIFVRITGNALLLGALLVVWWFLAAAVGPEYFAVADGVITSFIGDLIMFGSLWALWFHLLGGLRHLIWDTGHLLEVDVSEKMGWGMFGGSAVLTVLTAIIV